MRIDIWVYMGKGLMVVVVGFGVSWWEGEQTTEVLSEYRKYGYIVFILDHAHEKNGLLASIPSEKNDI